jgi:hypothetical protein
MLMNRRWKEELVASGDLLQVDVHLKATILKFPKAYANA